MKAIADKVKAISSIMDKMAGICLFAMMLLIVSNIILRGIFNSPIIGAYELVGFLSALGIGLALAYCAFQEGHIAVDFIFQRLPGKVQVFFNILIQGAALLFWSMTVVYLVKLGQTMMVKGIVSPSAEIPVYPFVLLTALGFSGLCLVLFQKFILAVKEVFERVPLMDLPVRFRVRDAVKRGMQ